MAPKTFGFGVADSDLNKLGTRGGLGAVYYNDKIHGGPHFSQTLDVEASDTDGRHYGITIIFHKLSSGYMNGEAKYLGYEGIPNAVVAELDLFSDSTLGDCPGRSVSFHLCPTSTCTSQENENSHQECLSNNITFVKDNLFKVTIEVEYKNQVLSLTLNGQNYLSIKKNLDLFFSSGVYIGSTSDYTGMAELVIKDSYSCVSTLDSYVLEFFTSEKKETLDKSKIHNGIFIEAHLSFKSLEGITYNYSHISFSSDLQSTCGVISPVQFREQDSSSVFFLLSECYKVGEHTITGTVTLGESSISIDESFTVLPDNLKSFENFRLITDCNNEVINNNRMIINCEELGHSNTLKGASYELQFLLSPMDLECNLSNANLKYFKGNLHFRDYYGKDLPYTMEKQGEEILMTTTIPSHGGTYSFYSRYLKGYHDNKVLITLSSNKLDAFNLDCFFEGHEKRDVPKIIKGTEFNYVCRIKESEGRAISNSRLFAVMDKIKCDARILDDNMESIQAQNYDGLKGAFKCTVSKEHTQEINAFSMSAYYINEENEKVYFFTDKTQYIITAVPNSFDNLRYYYFDDFNTITKISRSRYGNKLGLTIDKMVCVDFLHEGISLGSIGYPYEMYEGSYLKGKIKSITLKPSDSETANLMMRPHMLGLLECVMFDIHDTDFFTRNITDYEVELTLPLTAANDSWKLFIANPIDMYFQNIFYHAYGDKLKLISADDSIEVFVEVRDINDKCISLDQEVSPKLHLLIEGPENREFSMEVIDNPKQEEQTEEDADTDTEEECQEVYKMVYEESQGYFKAGHYMVKVLDKETLSESIPYTHTVIPGAINYEKFQFKWTDGKEATTNIIKELVVLAYDSHDNLALSAELENFTVLVSLRGEPCVEGKDFDVSQMKEDGNIHNYFHFYKTGTFTVNFTYHGFTLKQSESIEISPSACDNTYPYVGRYYAQGLSLGQETKIPMICADKYNNRVITGGADFSVNFIKIDDEFTHNNYNYDYKEKKYKISEETIKGDVVDNNDGSYFLSFYPDRKGLYLVDISLNGEQHIEEFEIRIQ
eukprot:CAMPEP_0170527878 /NCGR_PEP_ID=MMETSP0209-20121228/13363_1 /TAXON_ID=665100 ORGANISM="Litonotus pictus, Strain P1" /NCGR_SAMPLE_ID=MMETSP0209 /ASSEMBLY_ACC=CAM_ASM_000301 /LENGTH=1053 /DNA_ID=CAMNT_0010818725 /DNA_START=33 /DNA_END=3191 /DNA_ORIENTATION=+